MTTVFTVKFNRQSKPLTQRIQIAKNLKNERGRSACNDFSCDYFRCIFAKEKEFYAANEAHVLTNEEDATKSFNSVNPTTKQHSVP